MGEGHAFQLSSVLKCIKVIKTTKYTAFEGTIYGRERQDGSISWLLFRANFHIFRKHESPTKVKGAVLYMPHGTFSK